MKILAIDCSCPGHGSWAAAENQNILQQGTFPGKASVHLFSGLKQICTLDWKAETVLVGVGPGSFSGIRVGAATAQGLALAWGSQVVPIRSSDAIAWNHRDEESLGIFSPSRQGEAFLLRYKKGRLTSPPLAFPLAQWESQLVSLNKTVASQALEQLPQFSSPSASDLIHSYLEYGADNTLQLQPIHPDGP